MRKYLKMKAFSSLIYIIMLAVISFMILISCNTGVNVGEITVYTLTIMSDEHGSTTPSGDVKVNHNEFIEITDTPDPGYNFVEWTVITGTGVIFGDNGVDSESTTVKLTKGNATIQATHDTGPEINILRNTSPVSINDTIDFGDALAGNNVDIAFTIENNGGGDLIFSDSPPVSLSDTDNFTVTTQPDSIIPPQGASIFTIRFTPSGSEHYSTTVILNNNDSNEGDFQFNVAGNGVTKLLADDGEAGDSFGYSVAVSVDYAIVGANGDDSTTGAAYIFKRDVNGTWSQFKKLTASDGGTNQYFGSSVDISGDYAIVGAESANSNKGEAYIFYKDEGGANNWGEQTKLTADDGSSGDSFGCSVSINGDYAVVGAKGVSNYTGAAYLFKKDANGVWSKIKKLTASDGASNNNFGNSVDISGYYIVVGSYGNSTSTGAAYIFYKDEGGADNWGEQVILAASDGSNYDSFGCSVSIDGDYAVVGAYGNNSSKGAAYVFKRNGSDWGTGSSPSNENKKITANDGVANNNFGNSVSIFGNYVAIGSYWDNGYKGDVYLFNKDLGGSGNWGEASKITAPDIQDGDTFGYSVGIESQYLIIGARNDTDNGPDSGSAYIYNHGLLQ